MEESKTYLLINTIPNPENMTGFQLYLSKIIPIFMNAGGKGIGRYKTVEQVMGSSGIKASAVFEFPSAQAIKNMLAGEEFNSLNQLRSEAYKQVDLLICEALS
ncbi:MAG: DUF1330 domain-containing protein [Flavobacteriales bacterium]|nr:DUF1330 domain-containing protein [Flavobacteriales bacterium]